MELERARKDGPDVDAGWMAESRWEEPDADAGGTVESRWDVAADAGDESAAEAKESKTQRAWANRASAPCSINPMVSTKL